MTTQSLQETMSAACAKLEETATLMGVAISYDMTSVPVLEEIVEAMKGMANGNEKTLHGGSFLVGAYLGEIIRRKLNGEWIPGSDGDSIAVKVSEVPYFPIARVRKFIREPEGNSLTFFAQAATSGLIK